ncbi:hypothetical protein DPMN_051842 [Dreissena polymorpha]|uniref:Uncharacterized protein n=1 Tax=Dreissena polymorpha TaxID=45954 RepID=A0A9D4CJB4_DREPO|nr:hypothetical protein DPMN_051842 [Dreissena polymorpha]
MIQATEPLVESGCGDPRAHWKSLATLKTGKVLLFDSFGLGRSGRGFSGSDSSRMLA